MQFDVLLGEAPVARSDVAGRVVVVIDVLRAATTTAVALHRGAVAVVPFETVEAATAHAESMERAHVRLCGERQMQRVEGFDLGNSPLEYTTEQVARKTLLLTTTNGTRTLSATGGARACFFAGFVNVQATVRAVALLADSVTDVTILCAGTEWQVSLEDVVCAGRIVRELCLAEPRAQCGDGAQLAELAERAYQHSVGALATDARHARLLTAAGFDDDVTMCLTLDTVPFAVRFEHGALRRFTASPN